MSKVSILESHLRKYRSRGKHEEVHSHILWCKYGQFDRLWCAALWYLPVRGEKQLNLRLKMQILGA